MSYDLSFAVPKERQPPSDSEVAAYFAKHRAYGIEGTAARYFNENTGTYFAFEWGVRPLLTDPELAKRGLRPTGISFELNYARPHFFALEAAIELEALVGELGLSVDDPQSGGMGIGPFDSEVFVRAWHKGNQGTLDILVSSIYDRGGKAEELNLLPMPDLDRSWNWNYRLPLFAQRPDHVAPRVRFFRHAKGYIRSFVPWSDAKPIALPSVDCVLLLDTASKKRVLVDIAALEPARQRGRKSEELPEHLLIEDEAALGFVRDLLAKSEPLVTPLLEVAPDEILDFMRIRESMIRLRDG